ncbi:helix-turn-helix domain-containing protein [Niastella caeni]|nr:helix-turn-helix domain-containing protein [Niastella caeni]
MGNSWTTPIVLIPLAEEQFWERMRLIVREEIQLFQNWQPPVSGAEFQTPGLTYKPLYKMVEVQQLLQVSRTTIYEWIKHGKLKPYKVRSRVYFLWKDVQNILNSNDSEK